MAQIAVGDRVPAFTAVLQDGTAFDSSSVVGKKWLVLFFYPKDNTPVCTKEACAFRDSYALFVDAGNLEPDASDLLVFEHFRYALGVGVRYLLPIGPVRLDFGWNPDQHSGESAYAAHFSVGMSF